MGISAGNEMIKCANCNGFEYNIVATDGGLIVKCWTCGDKLSLKELYCIIHGHTITTEDADRLTPNDTKSMRLETACARCGLDVIARQNPTDEERIHVTQIHSDMLDQ